jgi:acetyltransferase-like isoleucine patch superfamily enzyme
MKKQLQPSHSKYDFPLHIFPLWDRFCKIVSTFISTLRLKLLLKLGGCSYGDHLRADGFVIIRYAKRGAIQLGSHIKINSRFKSNFVGLNHPAIFHCQPTGSIRIGDHSGCSGVVLSSRSGITIGRHVNLGGGVRIYDHDFHSIDPQARRNPEEDMAGIASAPIIIEDDVLIGANAIILKGVHVGAGSIIGAGSVVTLKTIPPRSLVAGNPARIIRTLP